MHCMKIPFVIGCFTPKSVPQIKSSLALWHTNNTSGHYGEFLHDKYTIV